MAYSQAQIDDFHKKRKAVPGKLYIGPKNVLYIGTLEGYLLRENPVKGEVTGTTLKTIINSFDKYSREELLALLALIIEHEEILPTKADKCFALAMSIAL